MVDLVNVSLDKDHAQVRLRIGLQHDWTLTPDDARQLAASLAGLGEPGADSAELRRRYPAVSLVNTEAGAMVLVDDANTRLLTPAEAREVAQNLRVIAHRAERVAVGLPPLEDDELAEPE